MTLRHRFIHLREQLRVVTEIARDTRRQLRWGSPSESTFEAGWTGAALECQVTQDYHKIERGLSLRSPRQPFGADVRDRLNVALAHAESPGTQYHDLASSALRALDTWNSHTVIDDNVSPSLMADDVWGSPLDTSPRFAGVDELFTSRHSVREYDSERSVNLHHVTEAVQLAINTPSVCNRQAWRVNLFTRPDDVQRLLALHNGNAGFADVPSVAVVSVDSRLFAGAGERNQRWIDGGLFAMSLVWALHSKKFATCMLNWSMPNGDSAKMRAAAGLQPYEDIIALVAIGYAPSQFRVARSARRPVTDVLRIR